MSLMRFGFSRRVPRCVSSSANGPVAGLIGLAALMLLLYAPGNALAATAANAKSPLGMNLTAMAYWTNEQPFLNAFKTSGVTQANPTGWWTHTVMNFDTKEEAYLQLDANGYPTTLTANSSDPNSPQLFTSVGVLIFRGMGQANAGTGAYYRAGQYVVLYDGQGTLAYTMDASLVSSKPGRDVINVANPTSQGIDLRITATDPSHTGNYLRNIRVVKAEEESLLAAGNVFEPYFLGLMQNFRVLRAMQWLAIDEAGGSLINWTSRPQQTDAGWGGPNGVPLEVILQLCNSVGSDCWLNVPHQANNDYITQMATLVHAGLNASQKVYVEFSNEVWNGYPQGDYATAQGQALWPAATAGMQAWQIKLNWYGMRVAQTCDIWKSVWGADASRVVCVMGAQDGNWGTATTALSCPLWTGAGNAPCASHNINALAVSPYFDPGFQAPASWLTAADGGLAQLFQQINTTALPAISNENISGASAMKSSYNLPLIAYEGGQSLVTNTASPLSLYTTANRDPRMGAAYTTALNNWKTDGGQLFVLYSDISVPNQFGEFGALESFLDTVNPLTRAPPKWQAIQNFISGNPCWWTGCAGTIGSTTTPTPMAPVLSVK